MAAGVGERAVVAVGEGLKAVTHHSFLLAGQWVSGALQWAFSWTVMPGYATARRARLAAAHVVDGLARRADGKPAEWLHALEARVKPGGGGGGSGGGSDDHVSSSAGGDSGTADGPPPRSAAPPPLVTGAPAHAVSTTAVLGRWSPGLVDELRLATLAGIDSGVAAVVERCCRSRPATVAAAAADGSSAVAWVVAMMWWLVTCGCCQRRAQAARRHTDRTPASPLPSSSRRETGAPAVVARSRQGVYGHISGRVSGDATPQPGSSPPSAPGSGGMTPAAVFWPLPSISDASASCAIIDSLCGHPVQTYAVTTVDGYILTLIRIPRIDSAKVVFFQHGLLDSASAWVSTGNVHSLASRAYQAGYDVFLGNLRGSNDALGANGLGANPADYGEEAERQQRGSGPGAAVANAVTDAKTKAATRLLGRGSAVDLAAAGRGNLAASVSVNSLTSLPESGDGAEDGAAGVERDSLAPGTPMRPVQRGASPAGSAHTPFSGLRQRAVTPHDGHTPARSALSEARDRSVSGASLESVATWATGATSRTSTTGVRFVGATTDGVPVHQTLHPRQPEYWNYCFQDHALDVSAFIRHIRIIKALEARHRRPLRPSAASGDGIGLTVEVPRASPASADVRPTVVPPPFASPTSAGAAADGGAELPTSGGAGAGPTSSATVDDWARSLLHVPAASGSPARVNPLPLAPAAAGGEEPRGAAASPASSPRVGREDIGAAAEPAGGLMRSAMALVGDGSPMLVPVARIGLSTRHDGVDDGLDAPGSPALLSLSAAASPAPLPLAPALQAGRASERLPRGSPSASHPPSPLPPLPASSRAGEEEEEEGGVDVTGPAGAGGVVVDATHPAADDVSIVAVGHSMGSGVLMLYAQMCRALGRPHWLDRCILLSPAGLHREVMRPAKWLLLALYHTNVLGADRPFPMRSSLVQRLVARFMQDLKRMQATSDLVGLVGSWLIGGDRSRFVFRYVSFTDYPIGGSAHKVLRHGIQNFKVAEFQPYDYGKRENEERYGAAQPPSFRRDFGLLDLPMHFIAGGRDALIPLGNITETYQLLRRLHPATVTLKVFPTAGHLDFTLTLADDIISHVMHAIQHPPHLPTGDDAIGLAASGGGLESPTSTVSRTSTDSGSDGTGCGRPQPSSPLHPDEELRRYGVDNVPLSVVRLAEVAAARVDMAPRRWGQWNSDAGDHLTAAVSRFPWLAGWSKLPVVLEGLRQEAAEMGLGR